MVGSRGGCAGRLRAPSRQRRIRQPAPVRRWRVWARGQLFGKRLGTRLCWLLGRHSAVFPLKAAGRRDGAVAAAEEGPDPRSSCRNRAAGRAALAAVAEFRVIATRQSPSSTARCRALGSTRHLAAVDAPAGSDASCGPLVSQPIPSWQKGSELRVGNPQMRWGSQPMIELYPRLSANRIKEMFSEERLRGVYRDRQHRSKSLTINLRLIGRIWL